MAVVSYRCRDLLERCLTSLEEHAPAGTRTWVVDNASKDGSAAAVRAAYPEVRLIENPRNAGFGAANNLALREASGEFLLLLNSDAFPRPGALRTLVDRLRALPDVGVVGPRLLNADGSLQRSCFRYPTPAVAWRASPVCASLTTTRAIRGGPAWW